MVVLRRHELAGQRIHGPGAPESGYIITADGQIKVRRPDGSALPPFTVPARISLDTVAELLDEHVHLCVRGSAATIGSPACGEEALLSIHGVTMQDANGQYPSKHGPISPSYRLQTPNPEVTGSSSQRLPPVTFAPELKPSPQTFTAQNFSRAATTSPTTTCTSTRSSAPAEGGDQTSPATLPVRQHFGSCKGDLSASSSASGGGSPNTVVCFGLASGREWPGAPSMVHIFREPIALTQRRIKHDYDRGIQQRLELRSRAGTLAIDDEDGPWPRARKVGGSPRAFGGSPRASLTIVPPMPQTARPLSFTAPSSPVAAQPLSARANPHINPFVDRPASAMAGLAETEPPPTATEEQREEAEEQAASYAQRTLAHVRRMHSRTHGRTTLPRHWTCGEHWDGVPRSPQEESPAGHSGRRASASSAESDRSRSHDKKPSQYHFVPLVPSPAPDEEDDVLWKPPQLTRDALPRPSATVPKWRNRWQKARGQIKILMHWRSQVRRNQPAYIKRKTLAAAKLPLEMLGAGGARTGAWTPTLSATKSTNDAKPPPRPMPATPEDAAEEGAPQHDDSITAPPLHTHIPDWWKPSAKRKTTLGFAKPDPTASILREVRQAAAEFDAKKAQYYVAANCSRRMVLAPRYSDGGATFAPPRATKLLGVEGDFPHPPHPPRHALMPDEPRTTRDRANATLAAIGEWTSEAATKARREAQNDLFAHRYVPPAALEFNRPIKPLQPGDDLPYRGLDWTRPVPPFTPKPLNGKLGGKPNGANATATLLQHDPGALKRSSTGLSFRKPSSDRPRLGNGRALRGAAAGNAALQARATGGKGNTGVVAGVRTSLDEPGEPPSFSLRLYPGDEHAAVFTSVADELNDETNAVASVTLRRLDGGAEITISREGSEKLEGWPDWALNGQFELFAEISSRDDGGGRGSPAPGTMGGIARGGASKQKRQAAKAAQKDADRKRFEAEAKKVSRGEGDDDGDGDDGGGGEMTDLEKLLVMEAEAEEDAIEQAMDRGDRNWVGSIWAPRAEDSSSGDFFDSDAVFKRRFDREWGEQKALLGDVGGADDDLQMVMWDFDDLMLVLFDFYGSLNSDGRISSLTFNEWTMFYQDFNLHEGSTSKAAALDRVFISVDTKASALAKAEREEAERLGRKFDSDADEKKALKRTEFCAALVQIATIRFYDSGEASTIGQAFHRLMMEVIDPLVDYDKLPDPNLFRRSIYVSSVSEALTEHATSLRFLHKGLSEMEFGKGADRMGAKAWLDALRALGFIGIDVTERDVNLCLVWSRMAVSGVPTARDDRLPFEGFLEALCRLASIKALPTDKEIKMKGCEDAGQYVLLMLSDEVTKKEYEDMLKARRVGWGGKPAQPLHRCVAHTLSIIVRTIEQACQNGTGMDQSNGDLSSTEVATWLKRALSDKS